MFTRVGIAVAFVVIAAGGFFAANPGLVGATGGGRPEFVTVCHAAGQAGTTKFVTLTIPYNAAFGQAGHFNENGTTQAGHEQDYLGACEPDETTTTTDTTDTTDTTTTTETTTTTTTDTEPPGRCPPGMTPTAGKDGEPGNDECEFPPTTTVETQPPGTTTETTTTPEPPVTTTEPTTTEETTPPETTPPAPVAPKPPKTSKPPKQTKPPKGAPPKAPRPCSPVAVETSTCGVMGSG